ncbi:MAG TPA: radical SAM protein [Bryobacteraceae bacterium]|nr:radical SAM protein [Bryobacteraceae bacterium]
MGACRSLRAATISVPAGTAPQRIYPIGPMTVLAHAKAALGADIEVHAFDFSNGDVDDLLDHVIAWRPDVIGFGIYTHQLPVILDLADRLRAALPEAILVAGGVHVTLTWPDCLTRWGTQFDYVIPGDGEGPFTALMEGLARGERPPHLTVPGTAHRTESGGMVRCAGAAPVATQFHASPLDVPLTHRNEELVFTDRHSGEQRPAVAMVSSRGCPLKCSFCAVATMPGQWRATPNGTLLDWLRDSYAAKPFRHIYFLDANFFAVPRRVRELAAALTQLFPGVTWSASGTADRIVRMADDLRYLRECGLRLVEVGFDGGSDRQLKFLNKRATVADNLAAAALLRSHAIAIGIDFIMFHPDQTVEDIRDNLIFLRDAGLILDEASAHYFNTLELYPATPLRTEFETRRGHPFDPDAIPSSEDLFRDASVKNIHKLFCSTFGRTFLPRLSAMKDLLNERLNAVDHLSGHDLRVLRLKKVWLTHVPFKVLWALCQFPEAETLEEAAPWLARAVPA